MWFAPRAMAEWAVCSGVRLIPVEDIEDTPLALVWSPAAPHELITVLLEHIRSRLIGLGWTGDDMNGMLLTEMGAVLLDEPRLAADRLALARPPDRRPGWRRRTASSL